MKINAFLKTFILSLVVLSGNVLVAQEVNPNEDEEREVEKCDEQSLFYSVQIGVFSRLLPKEAFPKVAFPVYYVEREDGLYAYYSGIYESRFAAMRKRYQICKEGNYDVYVAVYYKCEQVNMIEADELIEEHGEGIVYNPNTVTF
jgi:hypothetical protein